MTNGLDIAKMKAGGAVGIARLIGITSQAVSQWHRVPALRVLDVEKGTGVPRHILRPDLYPPPAHDPAQEGAAA